MSLLREGDNERREKFARTMLGKMETTLTSLNPSAFQMMCQPSICQDVCIVTMSEYRKFEDHQTGLPRKPTCGVGF